MALKELESPNWKPLEKVIGPDGCGAFMWMWRKGGVEFYKHIRTRRYLLLDSDGRCFRHGPNGFELTEVQSELERVTRGPLTNSGTRGARAHGRGSFD